MEKQVKEKQEDETTEQDSRKAYLMLCVCSYREYET